MKIHKSREAVRLRTERPCRGDSCATSASQQPRLIQSLANDEGSLQTELRLKILHNSTGRSADAPFSLILVGDHLLFGQVTYL